MSIDYEEIAKNWINNPRELPTTFNSNPHSSSTRRLVTALSEEVYKPFAIQQKSRQDLLLLTTKGQDIPHADTAFTFNNTFIQAAHSISLNAIRHMQQSNQCPTKTYIHDNYIIKRPLAPLDSLPIPKTMPLAEQLKAIDYLTQHQHIFRSYMLTGGAETLEESTVNEQDIDFVSFADLPLYGEFAAPFQALRNQNVIKHIAINPQELDKPSPSNITEIIGSPSPAQYDIYNSYRKSFLKEASNYDTVPPLGYYNLRIQNIPILQPYLISQNRLIVKNEGIWIGFLFNNFPENPQRSDYFFYWWSPSHTNLLNTAIPAHDILFLDLFAVTTWRDLKIVQERAIHISSTLRGDQIPRLSPLTKRVLRLPRIIYNGQLGSPKEHAKIKKTIEHNLNLRRLHNVKAHLRKLPEGWTSSSEAKQKALQYGFPPPPEDYTFIPPHSRGGIDPFQLETVIDVESKGLQTLYFINHNLLRGEDD